MTLMLLRFQQELRSAPERELPPVDLKKAGVHAREIDMAVTLVESMAGEWKPEDFRDEYRALVTCQHADGGWAPQSDDAESTVWVSAFCALMLIRGNRVLTDPTLGAAIRRGRTSANDYVNRARCYEELREFDKALADFGEAIRREPKASGSP